MTTLRLTASDDDLACAAAILRDGGLVAIPTETVYGLAVRADDADAIARLYVAKDRPADNPLIVHVADADAILSVAREVTPLARDLLTRFAPGPLTVVLPARDDVPAAVTAGLDTVAVRIPDHPIALALLRLAGVPLAAPSANRSTRPSPTRVEHVLADLDGRIDAVVDGGPTRVGLESTVIDARGAVPVVLRAGGITHEMLGATGAEEAPTSAHRSPGTRHRHYAPALPVHLADPGTGPGVARALAADLGRRVALIAVHAPGALEPLTVPGVDVLAVPDDVAALGAELFALLRAAESRGVAAVVVETVAEEGIGRAVMDRLRRAAEASAPTSAS